MVHLLTSSRAQEAKNDLLYEDIVIYTEFLLSEELNEACNWIVGEWP